MYRAEEGTHDTRPDGDTDAERQLVLHRYRDSRDVFCGQESALEVV